MEISPRGSGGPVWRSSKAAGFNNYPGALKITIPDKDGPHDDIRKSNNSNL